MSNFKSFFLIIVLVLGGCAPRDGEPSQPRVQINQAGQKLPTCSEESDPTWNSIRLYYEYSQIFDHLGDINVLVTKGGRNCVSVSPSTSVEIEVESGDGTGQFRKTGAHFFIDRLILLDTQDFVGDAQLLEEVAQGMGLSVDQLRTIILASPRRDQVTIAYLRRDNEAVDTSLSEGDVEVVAEAGAKLSTCQKDSDPTWDSVRIYYDMRNIFPQLEQAQLLLSKGSRNCVVVGQTVEIQTQTTEGGPFTGTGIRRQIRELRRLSTATLLGDTAQLLDVSTKMNWNVSELTQVLQSPPLFDEVTLTIFGQVEESSDADGASEEVQTDLYPILREPENHGEMLSSCSSPWSDLRIPNQYPEEALQSLVAQNAHLVILRGDRHCLPIGLMAPLSLQARPEVQISAQIMTALIRERAQVLADPVLIEYLAQDSGMSRDTLLTYLEQMQSEMVSMTYIRWESR